MSFGYYMNMEKLALNIAIKHLENMSDNNRDVVTGDMNQNELQKKYGEWICCYNKISMLHGKFFEYNNEFLYKLYWEILIKMQL